MEKQCLILSIAICLLSMLSCLNNENSNAKFETSSTPTNNYVDSINYALEHEFGNGHLPGFAVSIFTKDSIYYMNGYGYSDVEQEKPFDEHTIMGIASISKTFVGVTLMKAIENEIVSLDDPINDILPFEIKNPNHPATPITLKHLATHTSSINDDPNYNKAYIFSETLDQDKFQSAWKDHINVYNTNEAMPMNNFLKKVFVDWQTKENFYDYKPGTQYEYSNIGAALLAYCLELKMGKEFNNISQELIFKPLNMTDTQWNVNGTNKQDLAIYYNESYNLVPNYFVITYPDGGIHTTVVDLTKYMQDIMYGHGGNGKILKPDSYATMMTNQIPELDTATGVIWDLDIDCCIGHGGNDFGIATLAYFDPKSGIGKILFTNLSIEKEEQNDQFYTIFNKMFAYDNMIQ